MSGNGALGSFFKKKKKKGKKKKYAFKIKTEEDTGAVPEPTNTEAVAAGWGQKKVAAPIMEDKDVAEMTSTATVKNDPEADYTGSRVEQYENRKEFWRQRKMKEDAESEEEEVKVVEKKPLTYQVRRRVAAAASSGARPNIHSSQQFPTLGAAPRRGGRLGGRSDPAEAAPPAAPVTANNCWSVLANEEFAKELADEAGSADYIKAKKWAGKKQGYYFGTRSRRLGYHRDAAQKQVAVAKPVAASAADAVATAVAETPAAATDGAAGEAAVAAPTEEAVLEKAKADTSRFKKKKKKKKKKGFKKKKEESPKEEA